jgi:hypothetical protein
MFALQKRPTLVSRSHVATVISRSRRSHSNTLSACGGSSFVARELDEPKKAVSGGLPSGDLQSSMPWSPPTSFPTCRTSTSRLVRQGQMVLAVTGG